MSTKELLLNQCRKATPDDANAIIDEVERYCRRLGKRANIEEFISEINPFVRNAFSQETKEKIEKVISAHNSEDADFEEDPAQWIAWADAVFGGLFQKVEFDWGEISVHEVLDEENKTLRELDPASEARYMKSKAGERLRAADEPAKQADMEKLYKYWLIYAYPIPRPQLMARPDEDVYCYHKTLVVPVEGPCPTFDNFGARMSDYEAWAAWIYGVYSGRNEGRQVLWFRGQHGTDGKTFVSKIIAENLFGSCANVFNNASVSGDKRFITSFFEKAALIVYGDANDPTILLSEMMKQISAGKEGDRVPIERKGQQMRPAQLESRVWINSNKQPDVPNEPSILSRLLYVEIEPLREEPDRGLKSKFISELPAFLHFAKQCYEQRCSRNDEITVNEKTSKLVAALTARFYENFDHIFDRRFEWAGSEDFVYGSDLLEIIRKAGLTNRFQQTEFYDYLAKNGVEKRKDSTDRGRWKYYGMIRKGQAVTPPRNDATCSASTMPEFGV